ncbi:carbohydrate binding domain-containing protein [Cohnella cholangitidis]|uniref:M6 family metalloprotease domain-containing protein n=1 Tax=Cohnella cholangitidis TaxID=2598458 RepID=A0A7G5BTP5_9BACL|nr:carbohydrate binding domain-containing protein [Cohnella cholangitidis]QMV40329.1 M6 family metalloprotease domain-containing protein [Cohnella cholangitidis]
MMKNGLRFLYAAMFVFLVSMTVAVVAYAAPAREGVQDFSQPTGQKFQGSLKGDEWLNWVETDQGDIVVRDKQGYWNYAEAASDRLQPSGKKVKIDLKPQHAMTGKEMKEKGPKLHEQARKSGDANFQSSPNGNGIIDYGQLIAESPQLGGAAAPMTGTHKILVLLVQFNNINIQYSDAEWNNTFFNTTGKTVRNYYREVSNNRLDLVPAAETSGTPNDGIIKVSLNIPHTAGSQTVKDALTAADPYINYAAFDTDGNGAISNDELHVVTILAGYENSYTSTQPGVWGHKNNLIGSDVPILDGKRLCDYYNGGGYTQQGEKHDQHRATIGILAHELGHMLGLPDLYDTDYSTSGVGIHSLMGLGSWGSLANEFLGATPVHLDAWSKATLGFVDPIIANSSTAAAYSLKSHSTGAYNVVKLPTSDPNQYFLLENRQLEGYDASLNVASGGIAIWHIDESIGTNSDERRRKVDLEAASDYYAAYYRTGFLTEFSPTTTPNSNRYFGYYDQRLSGINVSVTSASAPTMTLNAYGDYTSPSTPDGLVSTYAVMSAVGLTWNPATDNAGIDYYIVNRDGLKFDTTTSTKYKIGASASTTYAYTVQAVDKTGNISTPSAPLTLTTPATNSVTIYYKRGFANPQIQYQIDLGPWNAAPMQQSEYPGYSKITIPNGTSYSGIVVAFNDGNGTVDNNDGRNYYFMPGVNTFKAGQITEDFPVIDTQPPTVPTGLVTTGKTDTSVSLSWTASTDNVGVTGYNIVRDGTTIATTAATAYTVAGLSANTAYTFAVVAKDAEGNVSPSSNPVTVTTNTAGNEVTIYYKRGFATPYIHYRPAGGTWTTSPGVPIPASEYAAYNKITINIGTATQLEACFNNGSGTWDSNNQQNYLFGAGTWTYTPTGIIQSGAPIVDTQAPTVPTNVETQTVLATSISISWGASTDNVGVTGYEVFRNGTLVGTATGTTFTDTGLTPNTTYSYTVKGVDAAGNRSAESSAATAITLAGNALTIYYKNNAYTNSYIHYKLDGSTTWTTVPGTQLQASNYPGYNVVSIQLGSATGLTAAFNNGSGTWDNNGGNNYHFGTGTWSLVNGTITSGPPQADSVTFRVTVPAATPPSGPVYLTGNFNSWNAADSAYQLTKGTDGVYSITLSIPGGTALEYKFTRGAWASVEAKGNGSDITNRLLTTSGGSQSVNLTVQRWKDQ